jgi:very-short-patch-repair endonuclease
VAGWCELAMGWEEFTVAAEYDGDQHRTSRPQYIKDARVLPKLERMGWIVIRVLKEDRDDEVIDRVRTALSRGWRPRFSRH